MLPIIAGIVTSLIQNNLPKVADAVINKGLDYVQDKTGIKIETEDTAEGIRIKAESLKEIEVAAQKHEEFMTEQSNANTANARQMQEAALKQDDTFSKRYVYYLASFWSAVTTVYLFCVTFITLPESGVRFADAAQGFLLGTVVATLMNYFFGSTLNSQKKTELLAKK